MKSEKGRILNLAITGKLNPVGVWVSRTNIGTLQLMCIKYQAEQLLES